MAEFPGLIEMLRRVVLSIVLAVVVVLIGVWLVGRREGLGPKPSNASSSASTAETAPIEDAGMDAVEAVAPPTLDTAGVRERTRSVAGDLPRVRGRILIPRETPAGDSMSITANGWPSLDSLIAGPFPVASDGTYELQLPKSWDRCYLELKSRWLYLPERAFQSPKWPTELTAVLGSRVECRLALPPGRKTEHQWPPRGSLILLQGHDQSFAGLRTIPFSGELEYAFDALPTRGEAELCAVVSPYQEACVPIDLRLGVTTRVTLQLELGLTVRGVVVDQSGRPVADAGIRPRSISRARAWAMPDLKESTDDQGAFQLSGLQLAGSQIVVRKEGHPQKLVEIPAGSSGQVVDGLRIELDSFATLRGEVLDESGDPQSFAKVLLEDLDRPGAAGTEDLRPGERLHNTITGLKSDKSGHFQFDELMKGTVRVTVLTSNRIGWARVTLAAGENPSLTLRLAAGAYLFVLVSGDPFPELPNATVELLDDCGVDFAAKPFRLRNATGIERPAGMKGLPVGPLPAGNYRVRATDRSGRQVEQSVTFSGTESQQVTLDLAN
jgi:hypothetical protein